MTWQAHVKGDPLPRLLETAAPGVRYLALRDLLACPAEDRELRAAQRLAHTQGPIALILARMHPDGYWARPGPGYRPLYRSTIWTISLLAQLGASAQQDERIRRACAYALDHALTSRGQFSMTGAPSGTVDCLPGDLCWAFVKLGYSDPRLKAAFDWMARSVTGEEIAPASDRRAPLRYYAGKCGPDFACGANNRLPCAWGATKVLRAFSVWPAKRRTPVIKRAMRRGVDFLFSVDPATAQYPCGYSAKPSRNWWKFGFPVFYITDLLPIVEAFVVLGYVHDPRLANALALIRAKQDAQGRWPLEYDYTGKTWVDFGAKNQPNKWVTLRALRVLKLAS